MKTGAGSVICQKQGDPPKTARDRENVFAALMEVVKTLRQISHALYDVDGEYRRNM